MSHALANKPENALKRAEEFIKIGSKTSAIQLLQDVLSQRRSKTWQKGFEAVMLRYIDLCVDLKDHNRGKDGLHQYRNMSQAQAPGSLEVVINYYVQLAEERLERAAGAAEAVALREAERMADLEMGATPESLMMSTMTDESDKKRTDRSILLPWLVFVWETYRSVLDILKVNSKLERVYHATAVRAFNFCERFKRKLEFRRLCDLLRMHLTNLQKAANSPNGPNDRRLRGWDGWKDESIEFHLQTRFKQLEVAAKLELWRESFSTVEDIHGIMQISKTKPKPKVMATYYEKLQRIFWVSENYLFHAYAWFKYFTLSEANNKAMTNEERSELASFVLLATMCIPGLDDDVSEKNFDESIESATLLRNQRMAGLLGFHANPSRSHLMGEILNRNLVNLVSPQLKQMYEDLEVKFHPLDLVQRILPSLTFCRNNEDFKQYMKPITNLVLLRLLRQLGSVYHSLQISHLHKLLDGLDLHPHEVEKMIVVAVRAKQLNARLDHGSQCLKFGTTLMESDNMRSQLTTLATQLHKVVGIVNPTLQQGAGTAESRSKFFQMVRTALPREHQATLNRKNIIERRKEEAERVREQQLLEYQKEQERLEDERRALEKKRLAELEKKREEEKKVLIQKLHQEQEIKNELDALQVNVDRSNLQAMSRKETEELIAKAREDARKAQEEEENRKRDQAKRLDYMTRALRTEEAPILRAQYEELMVKEREAFEQKVAAIKNDARKQFEEDTRLRSEIADLITLRAEFEHNILSERRENYEAQLRKARQAAYNRKIARARQAKEEAEEARIEEARLEEERIQREEEEEAAAERAAEEAAARAELQASRPQAEQASRPPATSQPEEDTNWRQGGDRPTAPMGEVEPKPSRWGRPIQREGGDWRAGGGSDRFPSRSEPPRQEAGTWRGGPRGGESSGERGGERSFAPQSRWGPNAARRSAGGPDEGSWRRS